MQLVKTKQEIIQHYEIEISTTEMQEILDKFEVGVNLSEPWSVTRQYEVLCTIINYSDLSKSEHVFDRAFCSGGIKFKTKRTFL